MNSLEGFVKFIPNANTGSLSMVGPSNATATPILTDMELKARKLTNNLNDVLYEVSNEPSLGFYRIQVVFLDLIYRN